MDDLAASSANALSTGFQLLDAEACQEALQHFEVYLNTHPFDADAHMGQARTLTAMSREVEAEKAFQTALQINPVHAQALHHYGVFRAEKGDFDAGIALIRRSLAQSDVSPTWYDLGVACDEAGLRAQAVEAYREALRLDPDSQHARWNLAITLHELGRYEQALTEWDNLEGAMTLSPDWYLRKGDTLRALDNGPEATQLYRTATQLSPGCALAYNRLGVALHAADDLEGAIAAYQRAVQRDLSGNDGWMNLGIALDGLERYDEAQAAYHKAIEIDPDDGDVYQNLGASYDLQGRTGDALAALLTAIRLNPANIGALLAQADVLREAGREAEASVAYNEVLKRDPANERAREALANIRL